MRKNYINNLVIYDRILNEANYIIDTKSTIRATAKMSGVSKTTAHLDLSKRLKEIDPSLYGKVRDVLDVNTTERSIRGGNATKQKYLKK